ncbi:MAG TPA: hypothetical protein VK440_04685 [Burkholderiales bacterium]|nr:hypothetical protein [Burkholderiales bacterium]HYA20968.1 hypothetical protein [Burkholderiales bacterium]
MVTAPIYGKWCDRKLWTVHEAICLLLAVEPETAWLKRSHSVGGADPLTAALQQYVELVADAMASGTLKPFSMEDLSLAVPDRRIDPREFLEWAKNRKIDIPKELASVLKQDPLRHLGEGVAGAELSARHYSQRITDRFPDAHEQVLGAALAALKSFPERCQNVTGIRRTIEDNASLIWPETHKLPLRPDEVERLIGRWLNRLG